MNLALRSLLPLLLLGACAAAVPQTSAHPLLAQPAPSFQRPTLSGDRVGTESAQGKPMVVEFFAKYCAACLSRLPIVERVHGARSDLVVLGIAEDEHRSDTEQVVAQYHLSFPVIADAGNILSGRFRVKEIPMTFLVDGSGKIVWVGGPDKTEGEIARAVDAHRR